MKQTDKRRKLFAAAAVVAISLSTGTVLLAQGALDATRQAAERGDADAQFTLGLLYSEGWGVSRDDAAAVGWFRRAAEQGHADAQYLLGGSYALGQGVAQDDAEAARWLRRAAEQGNAEAQTELDRLLAAGSREELARSAVDPSAAETSSDPPNVGETPTDLPALFDTVSDPTAAVVSSRPFPEDVPQVAQDLVALLGRELAASGSDENGWTDLHYAAALNLPELVAQLLDRGAVIDARLRNDGVSMGETLKRTLGRLGQDFEGWSLDGETPLHVAASVGAQEAAATLITRGANLNARTPLRWTPLHYAAWTNTGSPQTGVGRSEPGERVQRRVADGAG